MTAQLLLLLCTLFLLQWHVNAGIGYHYQRPVENIAQVHTGHAFQAIPTVYPLPPVPALPALPTARPSYQTQTQTLLQVHPAQAPKSIASAYLSPRSPFASNLNYLPPNIGAPAPTRASVISSQLAQLYQPQSQLHLQPPAQPQPLLQTPHFEQHQLQQPVTGFGQRFSGPSAAAARPSQAQPQPLRIPFGKKAVVHNAPSAVGATGSDADSYEANGRQLHQYAVVEIIDNDIEQEMHPFLTNSFFDSYRAQFGASGTGAIAPSTAGIQIGSRANALVKAQQRSSSASSQQQQQQQQLQPSATAGDAIALGSGGLGYIRLPNGNVYLGSGSLGYISGQERSSSLIEQRTRTGAPRPDPLHFGHGPLGGGGLRTFRFK